jgi:hypothetical protein
VRKESLEEDGRSTDYASDRESDSENSDTDLEEQVSGTEKHMEKEEKTNNSTKSNNNIARVHPAVAFPANPVSNKLHSFLQLTSASNVHTNAAQEGNMSSTSANSPHQRTLSYQLSATEQDDNEAEEEQEAEEREVEDDEDSLRE